MIRSGGYNIYNMMPTNLTFNIPKESAESSPDFDFVVKKKEKEDYPEFFGSVEIAKVPKVSKGQEPTGLSKDDIVRSINGTEVTSAEHAAELVASAPVGSIAVAVTRIPRNEQWLLMDGVGTWGVNYDYYLKYRPGGATISNILGCANLKKDDDFMWYAVTDHHYHEGTHPDKITPGGPQKGDLRDRSWSDNEVNANWIISRRIKLFGPPDPENMASTKAHELQTNLVGSMQMGGYGTYHRKIHNESWEQWESYTKREFSHKDEKGNSHYKTVTYWHWKRHGSRSDNHKTNVQDWSYA